MWENKKFERLGTHHEKVAALWVPPYRLTQPPNLTKCEASNVTFTYSQLQFDYKQLYNI